MRLAWILGLLLAIPAHAGDATDQAAEELIKAMRADELITQLVERDVRRRCEQRKCAVDLKECLTTINRDDILDHLVFVARDELVLAEMKAATAYFRSDAGARHRAIIAATRGVGNASINDEKPEIRAAMLAFLDTPAGYRLVTRAVLTNTDAVNWIIRWQSGEVLEQCRPTE